MSLTQAVVCRHHHLSVFEEDLGVRLRGVELRLWLQIVVTIHLLGRLVRVDLGRMQ